jgi:hypothetical protein
MMKRDFNRELIAIMDDLDRLQTSMRNLPRRAVASQVAIEHLEKIKARIDRFCEDVRRSNAGSN